MRFYDKKVYCPDCQRLVKLHEHRNDTSIRALCSRCGLPIWIRDSIKWRYAAKESLTARPVEKDNNRGG